MLNLQTIGKVPRSALSVGLEAEASTHSEAMTSE
jgi:hypothetical protein